MSYTMSKKKKKIDSKLNVAPNMKHMASNDSKLTCCLCILSACLMWVLKRQVAYETKAIYELVWLMFQKDFYVPSEKDLLNEAS